MVDLYFSKKIGKYIMPHPPQCELCNQEILRAGIQYLGYSKKRQPKITICGSCSKDFKVSDSVGVYRFFIVTKLTRDAIRIYDQKPLLQNSNLSLHDIEGIEKSYKNDMSETTGYYTGSSDLFLEGPNNVSIGVSIPTQRADDPLNSCNQILIAYDFTKEKEEAEAIAESIRSTLKNVDLDNDERISLLNSLEG